MAQKIDKKTFEFHHTLRVRYAESDPQGIVFNANYLVYFDVAITEYFRSFGLPYGESVSKFGIDFHVVHCSIDYKSPARFDEDIQIYVKGSYSGVKIFWDIAIFRGESFLCSGVLIYACVDANRGGLKKIDPQLAALLKLKVNG
ncbi:acyl-CoA thioesterase [Leptospira sp. FAT2]|uniref:acyl-CoA thioesterase n=1 Tax=Leptospira sanjuanensis TaxID=2879643 RepID=UPI001EE90532|nr:thioesterase family protein [Leptospira sanjuanensis]MCG6167031.1 acyl-CoA thioesterase [Leptospira sanjuanensis]MCG6192486.1 acyl-CoA thioesterase [Leptospira sanjuanensis]